MKIDRIKEIERYAKKIMPQLEAKWNKLGDRDKYILELFAEQFGMDKHFIFIERRFHQIASLRHLVRYFYRSHFSTKIYTLVNLGEMHTLNNQDHTTVINSIKKGEQLMRYDEYSMKYNKVVQEYFGEKKAISDYNTMEHSRLCELRAQAFKNLNIHEQSTQADV